MKEHLLLRNASVVEANRIWRTQIAGRVPLTDAERQTWAELGKQALEEGATIVKPATMLAWHHKLVAQKCEGSAPRKAVGRPRVDKAREDLVVQMAKEKRGWGYDRLAGALAALGYDISDQRVGNLLKRRGLRSAPDRQKTTTWKECIRTHMAVLGGTAFFSTEAWTLGGLVPFSVLFFIKLATRAVHIVGGTAHPTEQWMMQVARNATMEAGGCLGARSVPHPRPRYQGL